MSGFSDWEKQFNKNIALVTHDVDVINKEAAYELKDRIEKRTPIGKPELWHSAPPPGYEPGTLRASWDIEIDGKSIRIFNDQPYAERVETGWSTQAPAGMMRISALEWSDIVNQIANKRRK